MGQEFSGESGSGSGAQSSDAGGPGLEDRAAWEDPLAWQRCEQCGKWQPVDPPPAATRPPNNQAGLEELKDLDVNPRPPLRSMTMNLEASPPPRPEDVVSAASLADDLEEGVMRQAALVVREHIDNCRAMIAAADGPTRFKAQSRFGVTDAWKHFAAQSILDLKTYLSLADWEICE